MTIARHYVMTAQPGKEAALESELSKLADVVRGIKGSEGVELLHDTETPTRFIFIEKWDSVESHKGALSSIPQERFAAMGACFAGAPDGCYLSYVKTI